MLSCLKHPLLSFSEKIMALVPALSHICVVYYNHRTAQTEASTLPHEFEASEEEGASYAQIASYFTKRREKNIKSNWYALEELTNEKFLQKNQQLTICEETSESHRILVYSYKNPYDNKYDFLFLFFNCENDKASSGANMTADIAQKEVIRELMSDAIKIVYSIEDENRKAFEDIQLAFRDLMNESEQLKRRLNSAREKLGKTYIELAKSYMSQLSYKNKETLDFVFEPEALQKISEYRGSHQMLEKVLRRTFNVVRQIYDTGKGQTLTVPASLLNFDIITESQKEELKQTGIRDIDYDIYNKTFVMLDKYEEAAKKLVKQSKKITITNLGKACKKEVTAAAVSDSITKHATRIKALFGKYPERWPVIKEKLGPIRNKILASNIYDY